MKDIKPSVEQEQIQTLLDDFFGESIQELEPVQGGEAAQTLSFRVGAQEYIACYKADIGLNAMRFYARTQNQEAYQDTCQILRATLTD